MSSIAYQPHLRPALPQVEGPKEYRQERELFIRLDEILTTSGLEQEFIRLSMAQRGFDPAAKSARCIDTFSRYRVLAQLPAAVRQAHERLIGGRKQPNKDKILSLYEPDIQVIVRGKSGAEVEFGNNLWVLARLQRAPPEEERVADGLAAAA